jgi:hypothetical protein
MCAIGVLLLLAAPAEEAARLLKTAWASQYEWKEDGVRNATLPFKFEIAQTGPGEWSSRFEGEGEIVVVEGAVVRRHFRATPDSRRDQFEEHLDWILARFFRKPFDEAFKESKLSGPEACGDGSTKVAAGDTEYYLKEDRMVAAAYAAAGGGAASRYRVDYLTAPCRGGYAILGETAAVTRDGTTTSRSRRLELRRETEIPAPDRYEWIRDSSAAGKTVVTIRFAAPRFNLDDPVVLDAAARDTLKEAWARRYTLPAAIRVEGEFVRKGDNSTRRFSMDRLEGKFQIWGLDKIEVVLDEKVFRDPSQGWVEEIRKSVAADFRGVLRWLDPRPFDEEFRNCGFRKGDNGIVFVVGYPHALAFRLEGDTIAAHLENAAAVDAWWEHKGRNGKDGFLLERMTRRIEGKPVEQRIRYQKAKGLQVPSGFDLLVLPREGELPTAGITEYELKKLSVDVPR